MTWEEDDRCMIYDATEQLMEVQLSKMVYLMTFMSTGYLGNTFYKHWQRKVELD